MISTKDFQTIEHHGMIFAPENKDVLIFPEKVNGKYYALHRPVPKSTGAPEIWIAESPDLLHWGNHKYLLGLRDGMWDDGRIGGELCRSRRIKAGSSCTTAPARTTATAWALYCLI